MLHLGDARRYYPMSISKSIAIEELTINTIRTLSMDAVQKADSGHPGTPMALAPLAYVLWKRFLRYNPKNPQWFNRDRFVLSNGHACMLQYAMLYLTGYPLSLEDIQQFRQWGSKTPGHPENRLTAGIETTTGPLGQGLMNGLGMAIAEAHLAALYNQPSFSLIDHYTYIFCSDGDLMEGASHEAASLAGHLGLHKLIVVYDDNHISIEGKTELTFTDDTAKRFEAYHWHVQNIGERANDIEAITQAIQNAQEEKQRPSLIILRSHIAYGAPHKQDTKEAHGAPLGEEEVALTKKFYGWPEDKKFFVPQEVLDHMQEGIKRGELLEQEWEKSFQTYKNRHPALANQLARAMQGQFPAGWDEKPPFFQPTDGPMATRSASQKAIQYFAEKIPWLMGGSGDLAPSTNTLINTSGYFEKQSYANRNIAWGVREHVMCGATSGIALHGGILPFAATFFIFTDYARPSIRLACIMELPLVYVMTHDSIGLGEDGTTHQPIEHLPSFRAMPNMCVIRPADANETIYAWKAALERKKPTLLALTRQKLPIFDRSQLGEAKGLLKGAYVLSKERGKSPDLLLMGSGSEVGLLLAAQKELLAKKIDARVVSFPSWTLFREQPQEYRDAILPPPVKARLSVEAGHPLGWKEEWVGEAGMAIGIKKYGASAPYKDMFNHHGFTVENIVEKSLIVMRG
jgi:transketolase